MIIAEPAACELVAIGNESEVAARLTRVLERPIDELMVSLTPETDSRDQEDTLLEILGSIGLS